MLFFGLCAALALGAGGTATAQAQNGLAGLQSDLHHQLALGGPHDGAYVYDLTTKQALFSERATTMRAPASVEKLYTATAVLARMGPDARLSTTVYGIGQLLPGGVWEGNLYLRGGGDPTFGSGSFISAHYGGTGASVSTLVAELVRTTGIHHITGSVYGDESFFDSLRGEPSSGYGFDPFLEGTLSGLAYNRGAELGHGAHAPAAYAAHALWAALKADGVSIRGGSGAASTPAGALPLASVPSPTVAQLLELMLPPSDNFFAETLVKDLGARYGGGGTTAARRCGGVKDDLRAARLHAANRRRLRAVTLGSHLPLPGRLDCWWAWLGPPPARCCARASRSPARPGRSKNACAAPPRPGAARARPAP